MSTITNKLYFPILFLAVIFISSLCPKHSKAQTYQGYFSAEALHQICKSTHIGDIFMCEGYIIGVSDSILSGATIEGIPRACIPAGARRDEIVNTVSRHLELYPKMRAASAAGNVALALALAYRC